MWEMMYAVRIRSLYLISTLFFLSFFGSFGSFSGSLIFCVKSPDVGDGDDVCGGYQDTPDIYIYTSMLLPTPARASSSSRPLAHPLARYDA